MSATAVILCAAVAAAVAAPTSLQGPQLHPRSDGHDLAFNRASPEQLLPQSQPQRSRVVLWKRRPAAGAASAPGVVPDSGGAVSVPARAAAPPRSRDRPRAAGRDVEPYRAEPEPTHAPVAPFSYGFSVDDPKSRNNFARSEQLDGEKTQGSYRIQLPDGRTQIVTYSVTRDSGFVADVRFEGQASYPEDEVPADEPRTSARPITFFDQGRTRDILPVQPTPSFRP